MKPVRQARLLLIWFLRLVVEELCCRGLRSRRGKFADVGNYRRCRTN
jgi:hypothetical protein